MNFWIIFVMCLFCATVDDFYLQGILAEFKQKDYWTKFDRKYHDDWYAALLIHAFSWSFMTMLPILHFVYHWQPNNIKLYCFVFIGNVTIHMVVDYLKCNARLINLWLDQILHLVQVFITCLILVS